MAIKLIDLTYKSIFNKINIEIKPNEITSLVGKNGSGKTCFLNLIYGLDTNYEGKIVIGKKSIDNKSKNKELLDVRKKMFYLKQDFSDQLFNINILEDIKYMVPNLDLLKLDELLKSFSLNSDVLKKSYCELSFGELKKILLVIMLLRDDKIILLDDPTNGLDQKNINNLIRILKIEKRNGKIIIVASQDSEFLINVTDKFIVINDLSLEQVENKYDLFEDEVLLKTSCLEKPNILRFREIVLNNKKIKLVYRDNINDLIKDIYRNAK